MVKKIFNYINIFLNRSLDIIAVLFLIMNFFIWYINDTDMDIAKYALYQQGIYVLLGGLLINFYRFNPRGFVRDNIFFLLIFLLGLYNSLSIIMDFNGIIVDMGKRSEELILQAFPTFLIILAAYRQVHRRAIITALAVVLVMMVGYSMLAILKEHNDLESFLIFQIIYRKNRHQSILNNPNAFGEYAFIGIFISFFLSFISDKTWLKIVCLLPFPILAYGLILSGSRTALIMVIIFYFILNIYFGLYDKKNKAFLGIGNFILAIFIIFLLTGGLPSLLERIRSDGGLSGREQIWINTLKLIDTNLIKGIGYNNFTFIYNELFNVITSSHNMLLGVTAEFGIFGLIITVCWFGYLFIRNHNSIILNKNHPLSIYLILFNVFYITFFIGQMSEHSFLKFSSINTIFLILQALNFSILEKLNKRKENALNLICIYTIVLSVFYLINFGKMRYTNNLYIYSIICLVVLTFIINFVEHFIKDKYKKLFFYE